jgi:hypothetical protein
MRVRKLRSQESQKRREKIGEDQSGREAPKETGEGKEEIDRKGDENNHMQTQRIKSEQPD